jgi:hypothetical protein
LIDFHSNMIFKIARTPHRLLEIVADPLPLHAASVSLNAAIAGRLVRGGDHLRRPCV